VLPVLNLGAVHAPVRFGKAIGAEIAERSVFARKNYFYPDLPKGYQISQYELPVVGKGRSRSCWTTAREDASASPGRTWKRTPASPCTRTFTA
jgi:Asp-tRNA(Asn)/Glu-tRNA(Gln) amidotransferase B subunit